MDSKAKVLEGRGLRLLYLGLLNRKQPIPLMDDFPFVKEVDEAFYVLLILNLAHSLNNEFKLSHLVLFFFI